MASARKNNQKHRLIIASNGRLVRIGADRQTFKNRFDAMVRKLINGALGKKNNKGVKVWSTKK